MLSGLGFALLPYSWATYAGLYVLAGVGFGFFYAAAANLVVDAVPAEQQGISTGMLGVTMNIGTAVCLAVVSALQNANPVVAHIDVLGHHVDQAIPAVFADRAYTESFWVVLGTTLVALVLAVLSATAAPRPPVARTAPSRTPSQSDEPAGADAFDEGVPLGRRESQCRALVIVTGVEHRDGAVT
ncbi:MFS transporter [Nocardia alni]|uniref:MFS transporter n=1 Tax=Nocardia alni TaxID=2815723 RepID=UPI0027E1F7BD|nr:MFS transporter [Nocardia alni]